MAALIFGFLLLILRMFWTNGERLECVTALGLEGKLCNNGECMLTDWFCDGENDCEDGSDESCDSEYVAPDSLLQQYHQCQSKLRQCNFRYPSEIIPKPNNERMALNHVDVFCRYLEVFISCTARMDDLCYQIKEPILIYEDIKKRICDDHNVRNYTGLAMSGMKIWRGITYTQQLLQTSLNSSTLDGKDMTKRENVCYALTWLVRFGKITGSFEFWKFPYDMHIPDDPLLHDIPMRTFSRLMRPLDVKYGDLRLPECNRGRYLGYKNVYIDYKEIFQIMEMKYGTTF